MESRFHPPRPRSWNGQHQSKNLWRGKHEKVKNIINNMVFIISRVIAAVKSCQIHLENRHREFGSSHWWLDANKSVSEDSRMFGYSCFSNTRVCFCFCQLKQWSNEIPRSPQNYGGGGGIRKRLPMERHTNSSYRSNTLFGYRQKRRPGVE